VISPLSWALRFFSVGGSLVLDSPELRRGTLHSYTAAVFTTLARSMNGFRFRSGFRLRLRGFPSPVATALNLFFDHVCVFFYKFLDLWPVQKPLSTDILPRPTPLHFYSFRRFLVVDLSSCIWCLCLPGLPPPPIFRPLGKLFALSSIIAKQAIRALFPPFSPHLYPFLRFPRRPCRDLYNRRRF